jgi:hypothetical protein
MHYLYCSRGNGGRTMKQKNCKHEWDDLSGVMYKGCKICKKCGFFPNDREVKKNELLR